MVGGESSSRKLDNLATLSMLRYHRNTFILNKVRKRSKGKSKQKGWCREAKQRRNPSPLSHIFYQEKNRNKRTKKSWSKSSPRSSKHLYCNKIKHINILTDSKNSKRRKEPVSCKASMPRQKSVKTFFFSVSTAKCHFHNTWSDNSRLPYIAYPIGMDFILENAI